MGPFSESELGPISKHLADMVPDTGTVGFGSQILAAEERRNPPPLLPNINTHIHTHVQCPCMLTVMVMFVKYILGMHLPHFSPSYKPPP